MKGVELYGQVRRAAYVEGLSRRGSIRNDHENHRGYHRNLAVPPNNYFSTRHRS